MKAAPIITEGDHRMRLTAEEIQEFASRPGAKTIAVENFLGTLEVNDLRDVAFAMMNLGRDWWQYEWSQETYNAIYDGIVLLGSKWTKEHRKRSRG